MNSCRENERYRGRVQERYARLWPAKVTECGTKGSPWRSFSPPLPLWQSLKNCNTWSNTASCAAVLMSGSAHVFMYWGSKHYSCPWISNFSWPLITSFLSNAKVKYPGDSSLTLADNILDVDNHCSLFRTCVSTLTSETLARSPWAHTTLLKHSSSYQSANRQVVTE